MKREFREVNFFRSLSVVYYLATLATIGPATLLGLAFFYFAHLQPRLQTGTTFLDLAVPLAIELLLVTVFIGSPLWILGFYRYILRPLRDMGRTLTKAAQGDLSQRSEVERGDELGVLSDQINYLLESLSNIVAGVKEASNGVTDSAEQLSGSANDITASTVEVSTSVQQIAQGAELQARRIEEISSAMGEITHGMDGAAKQAQVAAETAHEAQDFTREGAETTRSLVEKMEQLKETMSGSVQVVQELAKQSQEIGRINDLINDIADQTHLLSLNAAIEAGRAGEAGRGFAVVADHVRKLAEQSSDAADQIAALISQVREGSGVAAEVMENGRRMVDAGHADVLSTEQVLEKLFRSVEETARLNDEIVKVLTKELEEVERVEKAASDIAAVVEENAAGAQQTAAATEEQAAFMEEITSSSHELSDMAGHMNRLVAQFTVSANGGSPNGSKSSAGDKEEQASHV
ncbi:MAG: hypothetical protein Kow00129_15130 [Thermoleophilia bacterium]